MMMDFLTFPNLDLQGNQIANDGMFADPEPLDEDDPEVKEEMFETHKALGWTPEDLTILLRSSLGQASKHSVYRTTAPNICT